MNKIGIFFKRAGAKINKNSPEILLVAGLLGLIGAGVYACFQTPKAQKAIEEGNGKLEGLKNRSDLMENPDQSKKELTKVSVQTGLKVAALYAIPVALGGLSAASILVSRGIMKKRELSLAAAYATLDATLKGYRKRVKDKYGDDAENELRYGIRKETITEQVVDENGKKKNVKKEIAVADGIDPEDDFSRFFDSSCQAWSRNAETNFYTLKCEQNYANDLLRVYGFVSLNDIYAKLGIPKTVAGQLVGWVYDRPDKYIDFGLEGLNWLAENGSDYEDTILLKFNVDGYILDKI